MAQALSNHSTSSSYPMSNYIDPFSCQICNCDINELREPVVTCCGHLFCWACIYRWAHTHRSCPLCRSFLTRNSDYTPLYITSVGSPTSSAVGNEADIDHYYDACPIFSDECSNIDIEHYYDACPNFSDASSIVDIVDTIPPRPAARRKCDLRVDGDDDQGPLAIMYPTVQRHDDNDDQGPLAIMFPTVQRHNGNYSNELELPMFLYPWEEYNSYIDLTSVD
ncbi:hypothetical protein L7F22_005804 [Adiantum nelumboides]|nr:hypothetical protein [Adiantum nelumboides]